MQKTHLALVVSVLCGLVASVPAQERNSKLHSFEKKQLSKAFFCEGATFGDLNRDGVKDVVSGPYWYAGPSFEQRHEYSKPKPYDVKGYSNNFFAFVHDFDADGWNDILILGFPGKDASWYRNPGVDAAGHWQRHLVFDEVDNESPTFEDLTGDGKPELICQYKNQIGWAAPDWTDPAKKWVFHPVSPKGFKGFSGRFTHGLGVGDIDGDGKKDLLWKLGWWKQPATLTGDPEWEHALVNFAGRGGAQMYAYDIDGDSDMDVVTSLNAHGYGLYWHEQYQKDGKIAFRRHRIMGDKAGQNPYGVVIGNLHAIDMVDMDGDGLKDIITGSRYWAHGGRDRADKGPALLYWFRLVRASKGQSTVQFIPHEIDDNSGVGTQVVAADFDNDGLPDVVVGNKMGTFVHHHKVKMVTRAEKRAVRRKEIAQSVAAAQGFDRSKGVLPKADDGRALNLDFETGDLSDWKSTGEAFDGMPVKGDSVHARRADMRSGHQGKFWVGTYERRNSDDPKGALTSVDFAVTHPYASYLVGGGRRKDTRVELVRADSFKVIAVGSGRDEEEMSASYVDLTEHQGKRIFIRLVDEAKGHWAHINFDDFRFHSEQPKPKNPDAAAAKKTKAAGLAPQEAASRMKVPEGFSARLIAGEPDLHQPIAFTIDAKGRLWVAEAHSYPIRRKDSEANDKIIVFEDTDQDGSYDKRTVFQDKLNLVSGLEVGYGGVFVGAAPQFMFIADADGDLVPDSAPEVLLDGWGYQDTHETLNAFTWGPDGWLYGCHGVFTHSKVGKPGTPDDQRTKINAGVWRFHPTKQDFEVFAWGTSNPWGLDFDDRGQAFITACVIPHMFHMVQGGRYRRQAGRHFNPYVFDDIKTIADHLHYIGSSPHSGNGVSGNVGGGHAHCGGMIYLGDSFPEEYRNSIFFNNVHGNRINRDTLHTRGSGYVASHAPDFMLANDQWYRGVNLRYGPDGNVFLIDWYDQQACHLRNPEIWDRSNGRLYKISYGKETHKAVDLDAMTDLELVELQAHKNDWYVRTARRILAYRFHKNGSVDAQARARLSSMLAGDGSVPQRLRALWALHLTGGVSVRESHGLLLGLLSKSSDTEAAILKAWVIQLAAEDGKISPDFFSLLETAAVLDASPVVRLYLASALQRIPLAQRWPLVEKLVLHGEDAGDHNLPLLLWYGIEPMVSAAPERALRLAGNSQIPLLSRYIVRRLASGKNAPLSAIIHAVSGAQSVSQKAAMIREVVTALKQRGSVAMPTGWDVIGAQLTKSEDLTLRDPSISLAVLFGDKTVVPQLQKVLLDKNTNTDRRLWALGNLQRAGDEHLPHMLQSLLDDPAMHRRAIRSLASYDNIETAKMLIARYKGWLPPARLDAVETLSSRESYAVAMLDAIGKRAMPKSALDSATTRRQLAQLKSSAVEERMIKAWGMLKQSSADKQKEIADWKSKLTKEVLQKADRHNGRAVFARTCMVCHQLFGQGGKIGPDITGSNRSNLDYILENILDPNAEVARSYMMTVVSMKDGRVFAGGIADENDETIQIRATAGDRIDTIKKRDIQQRNGKLAINTMPISLMPEGQLAALSAEEVSDLIAYLGSKAQVTMKAVEATSYLFFDGKSLQMWDANPAVWSVENGEIIGKTTGLAENDFLRSQLELGDFRLTLEVRLVGNAGNSGVQFRSEAEADGHMKGYQADIGVGWWGKLYEERGRALLWKESGEKAVKPDGWNTYEIVAVGSKVMTAINGVKCVDLDDPKGARRGIIGLQVHSGGPTEVRFKNLVLELNPKPVLKSLR